MHFMLNHFSILSSKKKNPIYAIINKIHNLLNNQTMFDANKLQLKSDLSTQFQS